VTLRVSVKVTGSCRATVSIENVRKDVGVILTNSLTGSYKVVAGDADITLNIMCR